MKKYALSLPRIRLVSTAQWGIYLTKMTTSISSEAQKYKTDKLCYRAGLCWIRTGSQPCWKSFIASYYRQFCTNIRMKSIKLMLPVLLVRDVVYLVLLNWFLIIFHFNIRGKLTIKLLIFKNFIAIEHNRLCLFYLLVIFLSARWSNKPNKQLK